MRQILKKSVILASLVTVVACSKREESFSDQLSGLKAVNFSEQTEKVETEKPTGRVVGGKLEYLQTVKKQLLLSPIEIVNDRNLDVIYPGSVLDGESFLNGTYNVLTIKNPKDITLSTTLQGPAASVKTAAKPELSDVREKINSLVSQNSTAVDYNNTAAYLTYISNEVFSQESFCKSFGIHASVEVLKGLVKGNFGYEESELNINSKKYVLIKVRQQFYNVAVDPKSADQWGDVENIGAYEPVYISSVDYGRVAHLLVETDEKSSEVTKKIQAGISATFPKVGGSVDYNRQEEARRYYRDKKITIMIAGGPLSTSKAVTDYDTFMQFLTNPSPEDLVKASAPIGYKVRTLKDNREVAVRVMYTDQRLVTK